MKYCFEEVGLRNARLNFRQVGETHLMGNVVYNELRARGPFVDVGNVTKICIDDEGKKAASTLDVDFVANLGSKRFYIQSAYAPPDTAKRQQESASL